MPASSIGAIIAILAVVVFAAYIIAGGITGLFAAAPDAGENTAPAVVDVHGGNETAPDEPPAGPEEPAEYEEPPGRPEPVDLCLDVVCPPANATCPDKALVSCRNTCSPMTGLCSSCSPDCSGHQATSGGGGGGPPAAGGGSQPPCAEDWSCSDWSECSPEGNQARACNDAGSCGTENNKPEETRGCTYTPPARVWVSPEAQNASINDTITVYVKINATAEIYAFDFKLYFDGSILNAINASEGGFLKGGGAQTYPVININNTNEVISFASTRFGTQSGISGEGTLATITFRPLKSGASQLSFGEVQITDPGIKPITASVSNGTIEVSGA